MWTFQGDHYLHISIPVIFQEQSKNQKKSTLNSTDRGINHPSQVAAFLLVYYMPSSVSSFIVTSSFRTDIESLGQLVSSSPIRWRCSNNALCFASSAFLMIPFRISSSQSVPKQITPYSLIPTVKSPMTWPVER